MSKKKSASEILDPTIESEIFHKKIKSIFECCSDISEVYVKNDKVFYNASCGGKRITRKEFFINIEKQNE